MCFVVICLGGAVNLMLCFQMLYHFFVLLMDEYKRKQYEDNLIDYTILERVTKYTDVIRYRYHPYCNTRVPF